MVKVTDLNSGNSCWVPGGILIEDKAAPEVICNTVTIACTEDFNNVPFPPAYDNCDLNLDIQIFDEFYLDNDICDDNQTVVLRGFVAIDDSGNESAGCYQTITIERPTEVDFPDDVIIACADYNNDNSLTDPAHTGVPTPDADACMYASTCFYLCRPDH